MNNNKNKPGAKEGCAPIHWEVGITALGDIFIKFANGEQHFRCAMDEHTAQLMGEGLLDSVKKFHAQVQVAESSTPPEGGTIQ
jgi:hypothetical protein